MTQFQQLMNEEPTEELSAAEVFALSEPWEPDAEEDSDILGDILSSFEGVGGAAYE